MPQRQSKDESMHSEARNDEQSLRPLTPRDADIANG